MKNKVGILNLGCPRNLVDSENILGRLSLKGFRIVDMDKAEIGIINTCSFIDEAKNESIEAILDLINLKKEGRLKKIIVYGCLAQRYKYALRKELPEVDAFVGRISLNHSLSRFSITPRHYAYLKICEGCINNCSYCVIPKIKGKFTSLDINSIYKSVETLEENGTLELNIIGQDITGFGLDLYGKQKLTELLKGVIKRSKNIRWLRLLYLFPSRITDELIDLIADEPRLCKYIDLPIQHINERILKLMNRQMTKEYIVSLIEKIRKRIPNVALRTSLIVGFPTETDKDFKELLKFIEEIKFERLGIFIYSREEDTKAYAFKPQIPQKVKIERFNTAMSLQQKLSNEVNHKFLGQEMDVLIDQVDKGAYLGRSQYDAPEVDGLVYVRSKKALRAGDLLKVKITDTLDYDLVGEAHLK